MHTVSYTPPFKSAVTIHTNDVHIIRLLQLKYGHYIISGNVDDCLTITVTKQEEQYHIRHENMTQTTDRPLRVIDDIVYEQPFDPTVLAFHGGAVEYNGGAYLFLAPTTSGKTTLTAYITAQGAKYLTDDCIFIDEHHHVHPFTTPIHLRHGGYTILQQLGCLPDIVALMDDPSMTRRVFTPSNRANAPVPLKKIFFITRTENQNAALAMTTTEKMSALMHSPIKEHPLNAAYLSRIAALTRFPCETLYYYDMAYVWEVMQHE